MSFYERVLKLSENNHRTAFEFRFEELFSKEEWCALSLAERQEQEKAFRCEVNKRDDIRMKTMLKISYLILFMLTIP